ncbi:hypothetical protein BD289DRAFT_183495 [Coniella lustricola]|uniref:Ecp2 effector protein domain-containing protein n=1 Tax=Coniella lustricola TaxID=2025994 RepID=A0A2T3AD62_9PEZI|nr:hypothetical protein BD289DRAFT_183495 [Coniella lustricola]
MHLTSVVMAPVIATLAGTGFTSAMPGPWSVPQEHFEVLSMRQSTPLNPDAVSDVQCLDPEAHIVFHDENAAQLSICNGLSGNDPARKCPGTAPVTIGKRGSALFVLTALSPHSTLVSANINISKLRWDECVRAARAKCPTGSMSGVCVGGATWGGDVAFSLQSTLYVEEL